MRIVQIAALLFAFGSAVFWMFASIIQYQGFVPLFDGRLTPEAWIVALIGLLPLVTYALICLFAFKWLFRKVQRIITRQLQERDD